MRGPTPLRRMRRESLAATRTPYTAHVAPCLVRTVAGDYVQTLKLGGVSFETADDEIINARHERLNLLLRSLASEHLSLWTHVVRERAYEYPDGVFQSKFAATLNERYRARLAGSELMSNSLYLSLVYRPTVGVTTSTVAKLLNRGPKRGEERAASEAIEASEKLAQTLIAALDAYEPERLGVYEYQGRRYSALLEFFAFIINSEWRRMPLPCAPINEVLATSRVSFGIETIEYRTPTHSRLCAMLGIKEYATPTVPGLFDSLLSAPFPLLLTQSFTPLAKGVAQGLMLRQFRRLTNAGDYGVSQAEELHEALDALTSNEFVLGDHHFSLAVFSDSMAGQERSGEACIKELTERVAIARRLMSDSGCVVAREDLALEAAAWAQLPGVFGLRARKAPVSSRNFSAFCPFHTHPVGRAQGNHWGPAAAVLMSNARSPVYFSLHASDPTQEGGGSRKDVGHTLILGPSGSGKTVVVGFLMSMLEKSGAVQIVIDKDHGLEILTRALGGEYLALEDGVPMGLNPLQLEPTARNVEFLREWLRVLARPATRILSAREESELDHALDGTLTLPHDSRRLSRLLEFLDASESDGVCARLSRWCEVAHGSQSYVFDNAVDRLAGQLATARVIGFDVTALLSNATTRTPVVLYLFHLISLLINGQRVVCWCDEFARLLDDPAFEGFSKNALKTWRKQNAVFVAATQSASDALESAISRTIVEQSATLIIFPHPAASAREYVEGLGLSRREFECIQKIPPGSRQFLIAQGQHSVIGELPLQGFDAELAVISGRADSVDLMHQLIAEHGAHPDEWLPAFCAHYSRGVS